MADLSPDAAQHAAPTASATSDHPWTEVIKRLQEAAPFLDQYDPDLRKRIEKLVTEVNGNPDSLREQWARTRAAYIVADVDRYTGAAVQIAPALREEADRLAVSSPGLRQPDLIALLRQTHDLDPSDKGLIQEIRFQARAHVMGTGQTGEALEQRIEQLQSRVQARIAGPEPPPIAETHPSPQPGQPADSARPSSRTGPTQSQPDAARTPSRASAQPTQPAAPQSTSSAQSGVATQTVQTSRVGARIASIVNALAPPRPQGEAPWATAQTDLAARFQNYETAQLDKRSQALQANLDAAAHTAIKALSGLASGPATDVLRKIEQAADNDPNGARGVIASMHPGGRHEVLRNEYNALLAQHPSFSADLKRATAGLENFAAARGAVVADWEKRGWDPTGLDARLRAFDQTITEVAQRVPGRESGKTLYEELSERAAKAVEALIAKVKSVFRSDADPNAKPAPAATPRPNLAPAP